MLSMLDVTHEMQMGGMVFRDTYSHEILHFTLALERNYVLPKGLFRPLRNQTLTM